MLVFNQTNRGTYRRAHQLAMGLAKKGHNVSLISTSPSNKFSAEIHEHFGVTYFESPDLLSGSLRSGWDLWNIINRIQWSKNINFDIIHSFEARPVCIIPALALRTIKKIPIVLDWADWFGTGGSIEERSNPIIRFFLRPFENFFESHFRDKVEGATVINSTLYRKAIESGVPREKILLLPNGSDTSTILPINKTEARRYLDLPQDAFTIGYLGSIFQKDAELMAAAFDDLAQRKTGVVLTIIGNQQFDFTKLTKHNESIIQTGWVEENKLNYWLSAMDLAWLPMIDSNANRGRFPLKFHDYLAAGKPIISTNVGDLPKFFKGHSFGKVVDPNPWAIAKATITLIENPGLLSNMADEARALAESEFNWEKSVDALENYYFGLVG